MSVFLLTLVLMLLAVVGMGVGVIFSDRPLQGSCGGAGGADCLCTAQGIPPKCEQEAEAEGSLSLKTAKHDHPGALSPSETPEL